MASKVGKKICFEILNNRDPTVAGPRLGCLSISGRRDSQTPNFLAISSRGVIPHMTPDVIQEISQVGGVHMALEDFIERSVTGTPPILKSPGDPLHDFTGLPKSLITLLAPRRSPAVLAPNGNTNTSISIFTLKGFQVLTNKAYSNYIQTLRPDISVGLADVPYGTTPGTKRIAKMGDRTQAWLSHLIDNCSEQQVIFAPILPIDFHDQSDYITELNEVQSERVSGLAFYDSDILPDIPATTWLSSLPRLSIDEPKSPHQILRQISLGIDILTIPFIGFATDAGIALSFRFPEPIVNDTRDSMNGTRALPLGIDMWHSSHETSLDPLIESCACYACTSHHKAFVRHLLSAKEMLGWVLLQVHNHHIISEFFAAIRRSIENETFEEDCRSFERAYESDLPEKSGQGPRARGYHFKSEGPGEAKKNKAPWGNLGGHDGVDTDIIHGESSATLTEKGFGEEVAERVA